MKTVLIDASSAILLYKAGLFSSITLVYSLAMVDTVFNEVTVAAHPGASEFHHAHQSGALGVLFEVKNPDVGESSWLEGLGAGERKTLQCFEQGLADFIIIDDRRGARCCRNRNIPYINALLCPKILFAAGLISVDRYKHAFGHLISIGRYSPSVVEYARLCPSDTLGAFSPFEGVG